MFSTLKTKNKKRLEKIEKIYFKDKIDIIHALNCKRIKIVKSIKLKISLTEYDLVKDEVFAK